MSRVRKHAKSEDGADSHRAFWDKSWKILVRPWLILTFLAVLLFASGCGNKEAAVDLGKEVAPERYRNALQRNFVREVYVYDLPRGRTMWRWSEGIAGTEAASPVHKAFPADETPDEWLKELREERHRYPWMQTWKTPPEQKKLNYSEFLSYAEKGLIKKVDISQLENKITGELSDNSKFWTYGIVDESLLKLLIEKGAEINFVPRSNGDDIQRMLWFGIMLVALSLIGLRLLAILGRIQTAGKEDDSLGGVANWLKGRVRRYTVVNRPRVKFEDVAGVDEAKEELREIVEFLRHPRKFRELGAKIPRGVLLVGPPGSGKTLLAKAVAGEAGVPFFSISGSEFVEMFVGVGASRVRNLFEKATMSAPCLIFIDEIDAVARQRGAGLGSGHDEREQTLNQLLVEMDGFDPNAGIIIIAATNRPDILDPALLRPGRFDRKVVVANPDKKGRRAILEVHTRDKPLEDDVNLDLVSKLTPGFSGADLANVVNEAAILAARRGKQKISAAEFQEAIERVIAGPERKSRALTDKERLRLAYHEAGHTIAAKYTPAAEPPRRATILPRGTALGYVITASEDDRYLYTRRELRAKIIVALAGRAAEETIFGEITTGSANDYAEATELARKMVTRYGMSEKLGPMAFGKRSGSLFLGRDLVEIRNYSKKAAYEIDKEIRRIIDECYEEAKSVIRERQLKLGCLAKALFEKESLGPEELEAIFR